MPPTTDNSTAASIPSPHITKNADAAALLSLLSNDPTLVAAFAKLLREHSPPASAARGRRRFCSALANVVVVVVCAAAVVGIIFSGLFLCGERAGMGIIEMDMNQARHEQQQLNNNSSNNNNNNNNNMNSNILVIYHGPTPRPLYVDSGPSGDSPGDQRIFHFSGETADGDIVIMDWIMTTMTTTSVKTNATTTTGGLFGGTDSRIVFGVFSFIIDDERCRWGGGSAAQHDVIDHDQLLIQGVSMYPASHDTIANGRRLRRAIVGGTGRFNGATGEVLSTHLTDDSWTHEFRYDMDTKYGNYDDCGNEYQRSAAKIFHTKAEKSLKAGKIEESKVGKSSKSGDGGFRASSKSGKTTTALVGEELGVGDEAVGTEDDAVLLRMGLIQWNPHWECFVSNPNCTEMAISHLDMLLSSSGNDFANIIEFEVHNYTPPNGWRAIGANEETCGLDWDTLFYNAELWENIMSDFGCTYEERSYAAGSFRSMVVPNFTVTVVGAHYPRVLNNPEAYVEANSKLRSVFEKLVIGDANSNGDAEDGNGPIVQQRSVLLADTNAEDDKGAILGGPTHQGFNISQWQLATDLGIWRSNNITVGPPAAPLYYTCCYSDNYEWQDSRIVANFGQIVESKLLFDPAPWWANASARPSDFGKGVQVVLEVTKV